MSGSTSDTMTRKPEGGIGRKTYGDDVAVAPGNIVGAGEERADGVEEFADLRVHGGTAEGIGDGSGDVKESDTRLGAKKKRR